jgi:hypothetical protein
MSLSANERESEMPSTAELLMIASVPLNLLVFFFSRQKIRYFNLSMAVLVLAFFGIVAFGNYSSGCWPAPKNIEYRYVKAVCPGQSESVPPSGRE